MVRLGLIIVVSLLFISRSFAQEAAKKPDGTKAKAAVLPIDPSQAAKDYDSAFAEWKEMLAKLRDLRLQWATMRRADRKPIEQQYQDLVTKAEGLEATMIAAAEAAVASESNKKAEAGKFLAEQLKYEVERDNYEPAFAIAQALIEHGYDNPRVYNYGGLAAACTSHFDEAQQWLKEGDKHSVLDVTQKQYLQHMGEYQELWQQEQKLREAEAQADDLPRVLLKTSKGDLVIELFENEAPNTVANFLTLADKGYFDGTEFHRVLPHFMAQGGDPKNDGTGGPGYTIPDEQTLPNHRNHFRGSLSMANTGRPNSGGSQFFLMFRPSGPAAGYDLNGKHAVFGRVIEGFDVLAKIQRNRDENDQPTPDKSDKIISAKVLRKRPHEYAVKKIGGPDEKADKTEKDGDDEK